MSTCPSSASPCRIAVLAGLALAAAFAGGMALLSAQPVRERPVLDASAVQVHEPFPDPARAESSAAVTASDALPEEMPPTF
ncbi:MAG: hypothetical protein KF788_06700 [Piscinibacter sp.]|nr:hypothetical protein [Piscinibacter sp.]